MLLHTPLNLVIVHDSQTHVTCYISDVTILARSFALVNFSRGSALNLKFDFLSSNFVGNITLTATNMQEVTLEIPIETHDKLSYRATVILSSFNQFGSCEIISLRIQYIKFHGSPFIVSRIFACGQTNRQIDMTKQIGVLFPIYRLEFSKSGS
jgi:hypothetical protein